MRDASEIIGLLGLMLLGSWLAGRASRRFGLPAITGQFVFGIAVGPSLWALLGHPGLAPVSAQRLDALAPAETLALIMIGLVGGSEVDWAFLRSRLTTIAMLGAGQILIVASWVGLVAWILLPSGSQAIVFAIIAATSSTAVSVALLREMRTPTQFARLLLATTLSKDLLLVLAFSFVMFVMVSTSEGVRATASWDGVAWRLAGSVALGAALAWPLALILRRVERFVRVLGILVLLVAVGVAALSIALGCVPLVTALTLGFTLRSLAPRTTEPFFASARGMFIVVCCVFFASAGAHLDLGGLGANWGVVLALSATRAGALWMGASLGARLARLSPAARRWAWAGFLPQAGVSLALVAQLSLEFPGDPQIRTLASIAIASIAIVEFVGPLVMRAALRRVPDEAPSVP